MTNVWNLSVIAQNQEKSVQYINTNTTEGINEKTTKYSCVFSFGFPERHWSYTDVWI